MSNETKAMKAGTLLILAGGLCTIIGLSQTKGSGLESTFIYLGGIIVIVGLIIGAAARMKNKC